MTTAYTSLLGLALPVTGELSGTWGDTVNDYITQYLDASVAGTQTISGSQTAVTLSKTTNASLSQAGSGATGSAQYQVINCTGNPASLLTVTVPAQSKTYVVVNATSTNQQVKIVGTGPTTGTTLVSGEKALIAWNGSDFIKVATSAVDGVSTIAFGTTGLTPSSATSGAVTVAGTLVAANGGTGQSTYTTGDLLYATGSTALSKLGIGTNGQILTSTGTAPQWSTLSGVAVTTFSAGTTGFTPSSATSGAVTLAGTLATTNGGTGLTSFTANGVVYASSSSALTTGSALTFDGTGFQLSTSTGGNFYLNSTTTGTSNQIVSLLNNGNSYGNLNYKAFDHIWSYGATEQMRLTSTGLGIGTSSPQSRLHSYSASGTAEIVQDAGTAFRVIANNGTNYIQSGTALSSDSKAPLVFSSMFGVTEWMRLDTSGNLGIGTSSWSTAKLYVLGNTTNYGITSEAPSGYAGLNLKQTSGNTMSFGMASNGLFIYDNNAGTTRLTLDSSGNLTLASPGTFTYSSGTANGVAYLNGSKVLTTGSALTFDGTTQTITAAYGAESLRLQRSGVAGQYSSLRYGSAAGNYGFTFDSVDTSAADPSFMWRTSIDGSTLSERMRLTSTGLGIGTSNPQAKLELGGTNPNMYFGPVATGSGAYLSYNTAGNYFAINAVTQGVGYRNIALANDGGNVGIGTSSPGQKLQVVGAVASTGQASALTASSAFLDYIVGTDKARFAVVGNATGTAGQIIFSQYSSNGSVGRDAVTIDSSGNLGLGVTPSAWFVTYKPMQIGGAFSGTTYSASLAAQTNDNVVTLFNNAYVNSSNVDTYFASTSAAKYRINRNAHEWYTAPSGTAGNAISFTQAMTLDASGNLLVGTTTSSGANVTVYGSSEARTIYQNSTTGTGASNGFYVGISGADALLYNYENGALVLATNNTERARITSGGNLLVGTTTDPAYSGYTTLALNSNTNGGLLDIQLSGSRIGSLQAGSSTELRLYAGASVATTLYGGGTERARITAAGEFLVGTTSNPGGGTSQFSVSGPDTVSINNTASGTGTATAVYFKRNATVTGTITVTDSATAYNTSSDYRLKDNPQPLTGSGAFIDALKPKTWDWKSGGKGVGFIAHEVQEVSPGSVVGTKDAVDEEGKPIMQAMEYGSAEFIANIIAELQSLRARVAQLEGASA